MLNIKTDLAFTRCIDPDYWLAFTIKEKTKTFAGVAIATEVMYAELSYLA